MGFGWAAAVVQEPALRPVPGCLKGLRIQKGWLAAAAERGTLGIHACLPTCYARFPHTPPGPQLALKNGSTLAQAQRALDAAGDDLLRIQVRCSPLMVVLSATQNLSALRACIESVCVCWSGLVVLGCWDAQRVPSIF